MLRPSIVCKYTVLAVLSTFGLWLILPLLWFLVPFPVEDPGAAFSQLSRGKTYTRVYKTDYFWPYYATYPEGYAIEGYTIPVGEPYFALTFALHGAGGQDTWLTVGGTDVRLSPPLQGDLVINATAMMAYPDGIYLPSWPPSDCVVLQQVIEPQSAEVPILVQATDAPRSLQVKSLQRLPDLSPDAYFAPYGKDHGNVTLLTLSWTKDGQGLAPDDVGPFPEQSWGLSKTFGFRQKLLRVLAPSSLFLWAWLAPVLEILASVVMYVLGLLYFSILLFSILWLCLGRPALETMLTAIYKWMPNARLARAIDLAIEVREQKREAHRSDPRRTRDLVLTDTLGIWRQSGQVSNIEAVEDLSIFGANKEAA